MPTLDSSDPREPDRAALRRRLRAERLAFVAGPDFAAASASLATHLAAVLQHLDPDCLGTYWPMRGEFNAALQAQDDPITLGRPRASGPSTGLALPWATREPVAMHFRRWDGLTPTLHDACGIPSASGEVVVPDVLLVPCVGFTDRGFRLGHGGGYYDRYLAQHPHITAIGVAWSLGRLADDAVTPEAHDVPLMAVVTERGVVG